MNADFLDLLTALCAADARFLVAAAGRLQDLADVDALERLRTAKGGHTE